MSTENINFQDFWNRKSADIPNIQNIKSAADKYKKKQLRNTICHIFYTKKLKTFDEN